MESIRITLETLYDILRNEKKREDLQKLEDTFFIDVVSYLREKRGLLQNQKDDDNIFAAGEREKLEYELRSIKRILKEIYEKREKKIIDIALNRSRTRSDIIDTSAMLREEKLFYEQVLHKLDTFRRGVLLNLFKGETPEITGGSTMRENKTRPEPFQQFAEKAAKTETTEEQKGDATEKVKVKFIRPMPSFVWKDMKSYGPFDPGEELEIYPEVAELLVRKGRAEKV